MALDFMTAEANPMTGEKWDMLNYALFHSGPLSTTGGDVSMFLSYQDLIPLMIGNLNSSETLMEQFGIAFALVHEFIVSHRFT